MINQSFKKHIPSVFVNLFHFFYNAIIAMYYFFIRKKRRHIYAGYPLTVFIWNHVSAIWYDHDLERREIVFLQQNKLKAGAVVFNIGAHHGVIALIFSKLVGKTGLVVAVEMNALHVKIAN